MEKKTTVISPEALQRQEGFCGRVREYWQAQGITPVAFVETYGCQQNEADSEQIRGMLEHCGYGLTDGRMHTLEEVGEEFNVTRERIRQIEAKALRKLRHPSRSKVLKDFLG